MKPLGSLLALVAMALAVVGTGRPAQPARAWLERHAPGETIRLPPQAEDVIFGPGRAEHSILWLRALGSSHLISRDDAKYGALLEEEYQDASGNRVYLTPLRKPAAAVVVSRYQWRRLPRLRGLYDRTALAAYVNWADRPEAAGFRWAAPDRAEIRADLGSDDTVLVRQPAAGWSASLDGRPLECLRDPIGFLLLDPGRAGSVTISLRRSAQPAGAIQPLPTDPIPSINEGGIVDGVHHTPPPFAPGTIVTIYGVDLAGGRVLLAGRAASVLYAGDLQINARLPADLPRGTVELVVEAGGQSSAPVTVEIR